MPGKITRIPGRNSKKWLGGRITRVPANHPAPRATADRLAVIKEKAKEELATPTEQFIGIIKAREVAAEAGIKSEVLNDAIANGEIARCEKQGNAWHISPSALADWIRSQP